MLSCVYYDQDSYEILDVLPRDTDAGTIAKINEVWNQDIPRKILIEISSQDEITASDIKKIIGHSMSTLHENIERLQSLGLIKTKMVYEQNKKKIITPNVLFVTRNPKFKESFQRFFQGIWVDSKKTQKVIDYLQRHHDRYFSAEELSAKLDIPVDDIQLLLSNWDSQTTRALSHFLKEKPFEKKVMYKGRKG
jgi:DNA-binding transcriptional regulator GbsR (MarR family)